MRTQSSRCIGILAGGGNLPIEVAASLRTRGADVKVVAIAAQPNRSLDTFNPTYVQWGEVGRIIRSLKDNDCRTLVIVGSVSRPDLGSIKPDFGLVKAIPAVLRIVQAGGDDAVLREVVRYFEKTGLTVISPADAAPELLIGDGPYGIESAPENTIKDVAIGFAAIKAMAPFDVGQTVIVNHGRIESIEGIEGTDAMLDRTSSRRRSLATPASSTSPEGILVKRPKPGQELRVDLPVIGPQTAIRCIDANLAGIAVEADNVIAVERDKLREVAEPQNLFIQGFRPEDLRHPLLRSKTEPEPQRVHTLGKIRASRQARKDAVKGAQLLTALDTFDPNFVAVVSRRHVLAVDHADHRLEAISRAANHRQWGDSRWTRRTGVIILSAGRDADEETIMAAARFGLSCVAVRLAKFSASASAPMVALASRHKIAIVEVLPGKGV